MRGYALKTWRRIAFPALLFWALAAFLLGSAGLTGWALHREKSQPYRVTVTASGPLDLEALSRLGEVEACTAVYELSAELTAGEYTATLTLHGVDAGFVAGELVQGILFPEDSAMPYLVLNEAALKCFSADGVPISSAEGVDWLNSDAGLNGTPVRLCGILKDGSEEPRGYMSCSAARGLLLQTEGTAGTQTAWLELRNFGCVESAAEGIAGLGCTWESVDADAAGAWPEQQLKAGLLTLAGGSSALAAVFLLRSALRYDALKHTAEYQHLREVTGERHIRGRINLIRCAVLFLLGLLLGGAALLALSVGNQI